ncbi:NPC intracellular cholesterol transporter 1-related protein 1 [Tetranychus urticae]|nr:NPC intracellular cholesterol transporter 1-related protein 1 [Tetranychus urticae]
MGNIWIKVFILIGLVSLRSLPVKSSQCIMMGMCDQAAFGHIPCVHSGPPQALSDEAARSTLKEICPHLAGEASLCCTPEQIEDLKSHTELFGLFLKACPSCFANYQKLLCHLTCSPSQSDFMKILRKQTSEDGKEEVLEVDVFLHSSFATGFYDSCKNITRFNERVIDVFCKPWGADKCTPERLMKYLGSDYGHIGHSPYQIDYVLDTADSHKLYDETFQVTKLPATACSESANGQPACACEHCPAACG